MVLTLDLGPGGHFIFGGAKSRQRMRWPHAYWDAVLSCTCSDKCLLASSFLLPEIPLLAALFCHCLPHSFVPPIFFCSCCSTLVLRMFRCFRRSSQSQLFVKLPVKAGQVFKKRGEAPSHRCYLMHSLNFREMMS